MPGLFYIHCADFDCFLNPSPFPIRIRFQIELFRYMLASGNNLGLDPFLC